MAALAFLLIFAGVVAVYAGITGQSVLSQLQAILAGRKAAAQ